MICVYGFFVFVVLLNIFVSSDSLAPKLITHTDFCKIQLSHLKNSFCPGCLLRTELSSTYFVIFQHKILSCCHNFLSCRAEWLYFISDCCLAITLMTETQAHLQQIYIIMYLPLLDLVCVKTFKQIQVSVLFLRLLNLSFHFLYILLCKGPEQAHGWTQRNR